MGLIIMGLGVCLILVIIKKIYAKQWNKGISADITFSENTAYPGDTLILTETVLNEKWLPLPMIKVKFEVDKSFVFNERVVNTNVSDKCYKSDVFSLLFYQKITRKLPFICTQRGFYTIRSVDVVSSDVLMDSVLAAVLPVYETLTVYPAPVNSDEVDIPYNRLMGTILTRRYAYEDPFEFRGIREYQTYDTQKSINWNASARTGELKVNIHDYTASQQVCILLNLENEGIWEYEMLKEKSISMACSLAERLISQGIGVSLISNGVDKEINKEFFVDAGCDENHMQAILAGLARIDLKKNMQDFSLVLENKSKDMDDGSVLVVISTSKKENMQKSVEDLAQNHTGTLWIFPYHEGMDREFDYVASVEIVYWKLEI